MKFGWKKTLWFSSIFAIGLSTIAPILALQKDNNLSKDIVKDIETIQNSDINQFSNIAPLDIYGATPILTQKMGPIVSYGSEIHALDWYGRSIWKFNLLDDKNSQYMPGNKSQQIKSNLVSFVNRAFVNWALDTERNILWLLTNTYYKTYGHENNPTVGPQKVIGIDSITGDVIHNFSLNIQAPDGWYLLYQIQALTNGDVVVYGAGNEKWYENVYIDVDKNTQKSNISMSPEQKKFEEKIKEDIRYWQQKLNYTSLVQGNFRLLYLIPISDNVNIAVFCDFVTSSLFDNKKGSSDLIFELVDDNFEEIPITNNSSPWKKGIYVRNLATFEESKKINDKTKGAHAFNKSFYKTIDGKTYYAAWEDFFTFSNKFIEGYGVELQRKSFKNKNIQSYTMDVNGNIFIKFKDDPNINKLIITGDNIGELNISESSYYNLADSGDETIIKNANSCVIFNVWGETGSLMMINGKNIINGQQISEFNETTSGSSEDKSNYGLAIGIVPNSQNPSVGDTKGVLNGTDTIQKAADVEVKVESLKSKLPSEITRNDITILNDGFLTKNAEKNEDGSLKYPAFNIKDINDVEGTFTIETHVDKIPWFSNRLPADSIPTKIVKTYDKNNKAEIIASKTSWKDETLLSYDFKNSIPSDITVKDINEFDPFQVSFSSKIILDSSGNQVYPKKTYSIKNMNDETGEITINVDYEYYALSDDVNILNKYSTLKEYNVFKSSSKKEFFFAGSKNDNSKIDIKSVPQLKKLAESNVIPSSFVNNNLTIDDYLPFIDTEKSKGYPISKMVFSFEANDSLGELMIKAKSLKDNKIFSQTYFGLNKKIDYSFNFNENVAIDKAKLLPSSINEGDIMNGFVEYSGFNSSDFHVNLFPNNNSGKLGVEIVLSSDFPSDLASENGFTNYKIYKEYYGFMNSDTYNKQYAIIMKEDNNESLIEVKKLTTQAIIEGLESGSLRIGGKTYHSIKTFVEEMFVETKGSKIPSNWENNENVSINITNNNEAGTLNISIEIKKEGIEGASSNLNIVKSYSGFVKGNKTPTQDNLSFISQELLLTISELKDKNAKEFEKWLYNDNGDVNIIHLEKILLTCTGGYKIALNSKKFKLITEVNEVFNTISIKIIFNEDVKLDNGSLKEYSVQYTMN